jgi:hypothetical protein
MPRYVPASALGLVLMLHNMPAAGRRQLPIATPPVAGEYACRVLAMGDTGAAPTSTTLPSVLGTLELDDDGSYQHATGGGRFHYEAASGKVVFESGPFLGRSVLSETNGEIHWIRFDATKEAERVPRSRFVNHICILQK